MTVVLDWQAGPRLLADGAVVSAVEAALSHGGRAGAEISVVLVDDRTLAGLHGEWLDDPAPTDVISFDLGDDQDGPSGELFVSVECAAREAAARGLAPERELALYLIHGTLHLCGFDDHADSDRQRMRAAERALLEELGYGPEPEPGRA